MIRAAGPSDPGAATVAEIAAHWAVSADTAARILREAGLADVSLNGRRRHRWADVWRLEGEPWVHPADWCAFREPLLHPTDLAPRDPKGRRARQWRRLVASGAMPSILLSPGVRRVRATVFDRAVLHV